MRHITVAYATMSDYYYICVSMVSVLRTAREDTFIDFVVLHGNDLAGQDMSNMRDIIGKFARNSLRFIDVSKYDFIESSLWFIKKATYYRLVLAQVLDEEKCLYLDGDTIVCHDLQELYETDMDGYCMAGVKAVHYHRDEIDPEYCRKAHLPDKKQYVNAGVLLLNLSLIRKMNLVPEFLRRMSLGLPSQDQDVLNGACYGYIRFLPMKFNTMVKYAYLPLSGYHNCFTYEEILEAWNDPVIIHYADDKKPWDYLDRVFSDYWWNVCRQEEKLNRYFCLKGQRNILYQATIAHAVQPRLLDVSYAGPLMLWGAGSVARRMLEDLLEREKPPLCCIVSDGYGQDSERNIMGIPVKEFHELDERLTDITLVIAVKEEFRQDVYLTASQRNFKRIIC